MKWSDLPESRKSAILALAAAEVVLTTAAAVDLRRRPQEQVRGKKLLWWFGIFVQPTGPIAYLVWGRKKTT